MQMYPSCMLKPSHRLLESAASLPSSAYVIQSFKHIKFMLSTNTAVVQLIRQQQYSVRWYRYSRHDMTSAGTVTGAVTHKRQECGCHGCRYCRIVAAEVLGRLSMEWSNREHIQQAGAVIPLLHLLHLKHSPGVPHLPLLTSFSNAQSDLVHVLCIDLASTVCLPAHIWHPSVLQYGRAPCHCLWHQSVWVCLLSLLHSWQHGLPVVAWADMTSRSGPMQLCLHSWGRA